MEDRQNVIAKNGGMIDPFNELSPAEVERLSILVEECAEVQQCATKILRHGFGSINPVAGDGITNRRNLEKEIGHLECAIKIIVDEYGDVRREGVNRDSQIKQSNIYKWLHHNRLKGK